MGQAKRYSGRNSADRPAPLENQITISLSRYRRDSVATMARNRLNVRIAGIDASTE